MTSPRLAALRRQLKVPATTPAAPAVQPAPVDLAAAIEALVAQKVAEALGNAPPRQGSRLHALEAKLASAQARPAMPAYGLLVPPGEVSTPVPNLRQLYDVPLFPQHHEGIPDAEPILEVRPNSQPSGRVEMKVTERDLNGYIRSVRVSTETGAYTTTILQRDPRNRISLMGFSDGRRLNVRHDDLRDTHIFEPVAD